MLFKRRGIIEDFLDGRINKREWSIGCDSSEIGEYNIFRKLSPVTLVRWMAPPVSPNI